MYLVDICTDIGVHDYIHWQMAMEVHIILYILKKFLV